MKVSQFNVGINRMLTQLSESITLKSVSRSYDSDDDLVTTTTSSTISGVIQPITLEEQEEFGGQLQAGDAIGYFSSSVSLNLLDQIVHNGTTYEIRQITNENAGGTAFIMAMMKQLQ